MMGVILGGGTSFYRAFDWRNIRVVPDESSIFLLLWKKKMKI